VLRRGRRGAGSQGALQPQRIGDPPRRRRRRGAERHAQCEASEAFARRSGEAKALSASHRAVVVEALPSSLSPTRPPTQHPQARLASTATASAAAASGPHRKLGSSRGSEQQVGDERALVLDPCYTTTGCLEARGGQCGLCRGCTCSQAASRVGSAQQGRAQATTGGLSLHSCGACSLCG